MICVHLANDIDLARALSGKYNLVPGASIFCDAIYIALVVLSCSTTFRQDTLRVTNLIDGAMAIALTSLFFIRIFSSSPSAAATTRTMCCIIRMLFDILGIFITLCAGIRLVGSEGLPERQFFS